MSIPLNSIFIATGSNLGDRSDNLQKAKLKLQEHFILLAESRVYESSAVDYINQPDFYNQVLEFRMPPISPDEAMKLLLDIEIQLGRNRDIPKGPRTIDLDLLFWGLLRLNSTDLQIPHPRLFERSFVVLPLSELPGFSVLSLNFPFSFEFSNHAKALS